MTHDTQGPSLSHLDSGGRARMVDVSEKPATAREAVASARVRMRPEVLSALIGGTLPKGDVLAAARVAGVLASKRTFELIPLCHPLPIDFAQVEFNGVDTEHLVICCTVRTTAKTGVEMEALVGVAVAALTVYDMAKSADKSIVIGPIQLERKTGGKGGPFVRQETNLIP